MRAGPRSTLSTLPSQIVLVVVDVRNLFLLCVYMFCAVLCIVLKRRVDSKSRVLCLAWLDRSCLLYTNKVIVLSSAVQILHRGAVPKTHMYIYCEHARHQLRYKLLLMLWCKTYHCSQWTLCDANGPKSTRSWYHLIRWSYTCCMRAFLRPLNTAHSGLYYKIGRRDSVRVVVGRWKPWPRWACRKCSYWTSTLRNCKSFGRLKRSCRVSARGDLR